MPIGAIKRTAASQNGLASFILPCKRLDFHYCDWAGSSRGMNQFLTHLLPAFAQANPAIEISVSPRPRKHPLVRATYVNGREKAVCVRNLAKEQIRKRVEVLRDSSGEKSRRPRQKVRSLNESVRGIWSPFHAPRTGGAGVWRI